jgi:hypothetical protein
MRQTYLSKPAVGMIVGEVDEEVGIKEGCRVVEVEVGMETAS